MKIDETIKSRLSYLVGPGCPGNESPEWIVHLFALLRERLVPPPEVEEALTVLMKWQEVERIYWVVREVSASNQRGAVQTLPGLLERYEQAKSQAGASVEAVAKARMVLYRWFAAIEPAFESGRFDATKLRTGLAGDPTLT